MKKLNCCQEFEVEYESGTTSDEATAKLCQPKSTRFVLRIREFLSLFTRKRSGDRRGKKSHKRMDEGKQHVYEA